MSSDEEDGLCRFGTPLDPIEEDEVPTTKKITLADQIVVDSNGRRRFHGAFTGGFSAGYWNTVGSRDGWTPSEFKSSRAEKAARRVQTASDFMDEEDVGEFGIAPQRIQTTEDFGSSEGRPKNKRKLAPISEGPIPGVPVLELVLESCRDKAAVRLLKRMDKRYAAALAEKTKKQAAPVKEPEPEPEADQVMESQEADVPAEETEQGKVYKCDMGPMWRPQNSNQDSEVSSSDDDDDEELVFDEDELDSIFDNFKTNRFGLDYKGLDKGNFFTIVGADAPIIQNNYGSLSTFTMVDQNKKKMTIKGQAFGVGAFEEDDDDIYGKDDMSKYDFRLDTQKENAPSKSSKVVERSYISGFSDASKAIRIKSKNIFKVALPFDFEPRNWLKRKSRFGPEVVPSTSQIKGPSDKVIGRHDLTPDQRGQILGDKKDSISDIDAKLKAAGLKTMNFTSSGIENKSNDEPMQTTSDNFSSKIDENLNKLRNKSFVVPESIPQIFDRFTSSDDTKPLSELDPTETPKAKEAIVCAPKEVQKVIRTRSTWVPCQLLCYKMNIEANVGAKPEKGNTFSLFECIASTESARRNRLEFTNVRQPENDQAELKQIEEKSFERGKFQSKPPSDEMSAAIRKVEEIPLPIAPPIQNRAEVKESTVPIGEKSEAPVVKRIVKPKTELEMKIINTQNEHPSKKKDIFKAIFDSDSGSDSSDEEDGTNEKAAIQKSTTISKDLMASLTKPSTSSSALYAQLPDNAFKPKSAREINILRNNSPPRGIFSGLTRKVELPKIDLTENRSDIASAKQAEEDANSYGPSLPPTRPSHLFNGKAESSTAQSDKSNATSSISLGKTKVIYEEKWIEKSDEKEKKSKKEKKHKKEKHKSKKAKKEKHKKKKR